MNFSFSFLLLFAGGGEGGRGEGADGLVVFDVIFFFFIERLIMIEFPTLFKRLNGLPYALFQHCLYTGYLYPISFLPVTLKRLTVRRLPWL